ncbi:MAG: hypothetical protein AAGJ35_00175 [Myxococcota bacterium]
MVHSKMVQARLDNGRQINASIDTHLNTCVQSLVRELTPHLPQGHTLDNAQITLLCQAMQQRYLTQMKNMQNSDEKAQLERGETLTVRIELDQAIEEAYDHLSNFKQSIRQKYGQEYLKQLRLQGETPRNAEALLQQLSQLSTWCTQAQNEFPTQTINPFEQPFQKAAVMRIIQGAQAALHKAVEHYRKEQREDEAVFQQKNRDVQLHDQMESQTVQFFRWMLRFIDLDEEARRLRPFRTTRNAPSEDATQTPTS